MTANKRSRIALLSLLLATASLLGVFAMINASSANASQGEVPPSTVIIQPDIIVTPGALQATLYPDELLTQTLLISNTFGSPITYTIYEMTALLRAASYTLEPAVVPVIDPEAQAQVSTQGKALVIITLRTVPDLSQAYFIPDKHTRRQYVYNKLQEVASKSQDLFDWLAKQGAKPERFVAGNAIAATVDRSQLAWLAKNPFVRQVRANRHVATISQNNSGLVQPLLPVLATVQPDTVEWNIAMVRADEAWSAFGITGEGAVVGIMDTGVKYDHPALVNSYRGSLGGGVFDHNFNWYDWVNGQPVPYDGMGHGTMMTGVVSGDDGGANQIGVAPGADWIAAKVCSDGGSCSDYSIYHGFEWMMAPTDLNGQNGDPNKAPDIVFGGWGSAGCDDSWDIYIMVLRAAGILPIFSGGNGGPQCNSIGSPGDNPSVLTASATDENDIISDFSPRGSSCYGLIKPDVAAPGVNIRSSFNNDEYMVWSGTAESTAHVAGVAALIISADPFLGAGQIEPILYASSVCHEDLACGGEACPGPNNVYGYGRIDAYEAVYLALGNPPHTDLPWLSEAPISGTIPAGEGAAIEVTFNSAGLEPGSYTGTLGILSNDPDQPLTYVPVSLDVLVLPSPVISIDPLSFSATLPVGGLQTDTLTISNDGDAVLTFTINEISTTRNLLNPSVDLSLPDPYPAGTPVVVDANVSAQLLFLGDSRLILYLRGGMDFSSANSFTNRAERGQYVYDQLLTLAAQSHELYDWLQARGAQPQRLLTANAIAATLDASELKEVLKYPQVGRVSINGYAEVLEDGTGAIDLRSALANEPSTVEWNISKIRADEAWSTFGITGQGAVVGIVDTGVKYDHPALVNSYRGNLGGGLFDHNYNWYDFVEGQPVPYDPINHGTLGAGIISGDDGADNQIGVAPGADWIAVRACDFSCTDVDLLAALQWMLAPTDLSNSNPDPAKAPDVVIGMWGGSGCSNFFLSSLSALRSAGILPVFPPGSSGSGCNTMGSPGDLPEALSAGATDQNDNIAPFSSRGPSCHDEIKPDITAPGVLIRSSNNTDSYSETSGTSWSAAHAAGAAAMVISANQMLGPDEVEETLYSTALCREQLVCGGASCPGANNTYGNGRIDVFEAVSATLGTPVDIPWLTVGLLQGELQPGEILNTNVVINAANMEPGVYHAGVAIKSNDPLAPITTLPVTLTVFVPCEPITDLTASSSPHNPYVGDVVSFTGSANGTPPITYTWHFGALMLPGPDASYIFTAPGLAIVGFEAENACTEPLMIALYVPVRQKFMLPVITK